MNENEFEWRPGKSTCAPKQTSIKSYVPNRNASRDLPNSTSSLKEFFSSTSKLLFGVFCFLGVAGMYKTFSGSENKINPVARHIEERCQDTSKPLYCESRANICLWNLDGKGKYTGIDVESVTSSEEPKKVIWFNPDYREEMARRGWVFDGNSRVFTSAEKDKANRVANYQVFQKALSKS